MTKKSKKHKHHKRPLGINMQRTIVSGISVAIPDELRLRTNVDASGLRALVDQVNHIQSEPARPREGTRQQQSVEVMFPEVTATLALIATNAWRAKVKMVEPETGQPKQELSRIYRHIEGIFNAFDELGVKTVDPTGRAYDSGMALKVISFEQTPGLSREEIKETIKPTITWNDRLIQMGEVIVGTPQQKTEQQEIKDEQNDH